MFELCGYIFAHWVVDKCRAILQNLAVMEVSEVEVTSPNISTAKNLFHRVMLLLCFSRFILRNWSEGFIDHWSIHFNRQKVWISGVQNHGTLRKVNFPGKSFYSFSDQQVFICDRCLTYRCSSRSWGSRRSRWSSPSAGTTLTLMLNNNIWIQWRIEAARFVEPAICI